MGVHGPFWSCREEVVVIGRDLGLTSRATGPRRRVGTAGWNVWRGFIGLAYLAAAVFNIVYTLPRQDEVVANYGGDAWFGFLAEFMNEIWAPNAELFMVLVIAFEVIVGLLLLSWGRFVDVGVGASLIWVLAVLPFLAWPYLLTNVALLAMQGVIAVRRYDATIWELVGHAMSGAWRRPQPH